MLLNDNSDALSSLETLRCGFTGAQEEESDLVSVESDSSSSSSSLDNNSSSSMLNDSRGAVVSLEILRRGCVGEQCCDFLEGASISVAQRLFTFMPAPRRRRGFAALFGAQGAMALSSTTVITKFVVFIWEKNWARGNMVFSVRVKCFESQRLWFVWRVACLVIFWNMLDAVVCGSSTGRLRKYGNTSEHQHHPIGGRWRLFSSTKRLPRDMMT